MTHATEQVGDSVIIERPAGQTPANLGKLIEKLDGLPTIPIIANRIADLVDDPDASAASIAAVLQTDQSLTAKVLKLANSAYYAIPGGVTNVHRAISFLGFNTLYQLVLSITVISAFGKAVGEGFDARQLWKHALGSAVLAEIIARRVGFNAPNVCFTGGLLHDIGKVALMQVAPDQFQEAVTIAKSRGITVAESMSEVGLPDHDSVGKRLAERWRFPMPLRMAISHHAYLSEENRGSVPRNMIPYVDITALANTLARRFQFGDPGDDMIPDIPPELLERLNLTDNTVALFQDELLRAVERSKALMEIVESSG